MRRRNVGFVMAAFGFVITVLSAQWGYALYKDVAPLACIWKLENSFCVRIAAVKTAINSNFRLVYEPHYLYFGVFLFVVGMLLLIIPSRRNNQLQNH